MNQLDLKNRVAVITGGARGIGYAAARRALQSGAAVSLWDVDGERGEAARQELSSHGTVSSVHVELTECASVEAAADATIAEHGRIDILVNNAGIAGGNGPTWELDPEVWRRVIDVNLVGSFLACRAVIPHMLTGGYGRIVNVASIAGKEGNPMAAAYSASKAAVIALTKAIGKDLARTGVLVNCVAPAVIETPILEGVSQAHIDYMVERIPMGRMGSPDEVAALIGWLASEECSFSTGATYDISGGRAVY